MPQIDLKPGEKIFLQKIEQHPAAKEAFEKGKKETQEFLSQRIEEIKQELLNVPEIKKEESLHPEEPVNLDLVAEAIDLSLEKSVEDGVRFISQKGDPHLLDLFHDTLVGHYLEKLIQLGKVKLEEKESKKRTSKVIVFFFLILFFFAIVLFLTWQLTKK